mmetsp:Transcript_34597/g.101667  ORF Transcript_34597/g.101667 Transcript_34597/m.101667 type:complete len:80 (+) Transcript_34597:545-784(+)
MSAFLMVERRWAMTIVVLLSASSRESRAFCTMRSLSLSKALVASSSSKIFGCITKTRANATRCFCPPDSCAPLSPHRVS